MEVGSCGHGNPVGAAFCSTCGAALTPETARPKCSECGARLPVDASFCSACGAAVASLDSISFEGERRQLTVMFCDMVGSTDLSSQLDPEHFQEVVDAYYRMCGDSISARDGYVANYIGDGILAYFGYPHALEDAATRAVRAGLDMQRAVNEANEAGGVGPGVPITVRVGVHTGLVVIDEVGAAMRRETHALGDSMNLAARVQAAAAPGEVFLTEATLRLLDDRIVVEARGQHELTGVPGPVLLYRAIGTGGRTRPDERRGAAGRFVGREPELDVLRVAWEAVSAGEGQLVTVVGEPGVGKSRMVRQLHEEIGPAVRWVEGRASAFGRTTPFGAVTDVIERDLTGRGFTSATERREVLLEEVGPEGARMLGLLVGLGGFGAPQIVTAEAERRRTIQHLVTWMLRLGSERPAVMVLEDLHWADASSVEVLTQLVAELADTSVLVVLISRPDDPPALATRAPATVIKLDRLDVDETRTLIADAVGRATNSKLIDELVARSDGVPLFAEELARAFVAGRGQELSAVPPTLQDSLMARIDELGAAKPIAQVAAVFGREFSADLIARVAGLDVAEVEQTLDVLVTSEVVERQRSADLPLYGFRHALVQQAAYDALLLRDRRSLHTRVADVLDTGVPFEVTAQHLTAAGLPDRAADAWSRAGEEAASRFAWQEAGAHFTHAIEEVRQLRQTQTTVQRELDLELQRLQALEMGGSFAGPEALACVERARALGERLGDPGTRIPVLYGMWATTLSSGRVEASLQLAEETARAADATGITSHRRMADVTLAGAYYNLCRIDDALRHASAVLEPGAEEISDMERSQALMYGTLAGVVGLRAGSTEAWMADLAELARSDKADLIAGLIARVGASVAGVWRRDYQLIDEMTGLLSANAEAFGMPMFAAWADIYGGWSAAMTGGDGRAAERIVRGVTSHVELGQGLGLNHSFALLAEARLELGQLDGGLAAVEEGVTAAPEDTQPLHASELRRVRGALNAASGRHDLVEADLRTALDIASAAGCDLVVIRAADDLARWSHRQGRDSATTELLAVLERLDPEIGHPDVVSAKATARSVEVTS